MRKLTNILFISILLLLSFVGLFLSISIWYIIVILILYFFTALIASSLIYLNYHVKAYCSNPTEKDKKIALTFDDGPNETTLLVLDLLKTHNAKAAFFCIGKNIEKHPDILKKMVADGHIIGNHSYNHSHFFDFYRKDKVAEEIKQTDSIIESVTGKKVRFFRPPYGVTTPSIRRALAVTKHKVIGWNIRSMDGIIKNEKLILNRITKRVKPGAIVLLHDTSLTTLSVLEQFLLFLEQNNYKIVSLQELLKIEAYEN